MKIYLLRHGETEWNIEGRIQGWKNSNLTERGIEDIKKLSERIKHINLDCIYCSPLGRAIETAKYVRGDKNIDIITIDSLKEMGFGIWEGMSNCEIEEAYPNEYYNYWNKPHLYKTIDGESFEELIFRTKKMLNEIISSSTKENVLIVSHGVVIKAIYMIIKNIPLENFWNPPFINNGCLTVIEIKDNKINMVLEADNSHLI